MGAASVAVQQKKISTKTASSGLSAAAGGDASGLAVAHVGQLRRIVSAQLPAYDSLVGLEICLSICEHHLSGLPLTVTRLQHSVRRSPGAIRRIVQFMERDGWILIERQPDDGRGRIIRPTAKLADVFEALLA